jgi:hypothetical protein
MKRIKYALIVTAGISALAVIMYPAQTFLAFLAAWLLVPIVVFGCLAYGLREYMKNRKNSIVVSIKRSDTATRMMELAHKECELKREKEILYEDIRKNKIYNK